MKCLFLHCPTFRIIDWQHEQWWEEYELFSLLCVLAKNKQLCDSRLIGFRMQVISRAYSVSDTFQSTQLADLFQVARVVWIVVSPPYILGLKARGFTAILIKYLTVYAVVIDCLNESAKKFYQLFGFELLDEDNSKTRLFLPMKTIEQLFNTWVHPLTLCWYTPKSATISPKFF